MDEPAENPDVIRHETVKRPMNAFLIFCKRHRGLVHEKNPSLDNRSVTRILGDLWANLGQQEKYMYTDLAKQVWGHPFMTSTKNPVFDPPPLSTGVHMGRTPRPPPCGRPHAVDKKYTPLC